MATHSSVLAWRIPGMGEPGGLPFTGSDRVGHDWSDLAAAAAAAWEIFVCKLFRWKTIWFYWFSLFFFPSIIFYSYHYFIPLPTLNLIYSFLFYLLKLVYLRSKVYRLFLKGSAAVASKSLQSCPTLCDPIDGSPPGSSVPGSLQARTLEWVAISFSNAWKWKVKVKPLSRANS